MVCFSSIVWALLIALTCLLFLHLKITTFFGNFNKISFLYNFLSWNDFEIPFLSFLSVSDIYILLPLKYLQWNSAQCLFLMCCLNASLLHQSIMESSSEKFLPWTRISWQFFLLKPVTIKRISDIMLSVNSGYSPKFQKHQIIWNY